MKIRRGERATMLAIVLGVLSICYVVLNTLAQAATVQPAIAEPWTYPEIQQCELPLWERIRYLCPKEETNES